MFSWEDVSAQGNNRRVTVAAWPTLILIQDPRLIQPRRPEAIDFLMACLLVCVACFLPRGLAWYRFDAVLDVHALEPRRLLQPSRTVLCLLLAAAVAHTSGEVTLSLASCALR